MTVLLICSGGFSSAILVKKIQEAAAKQGLEINVSAQGTNFNALKGKLDEIDVILLAPQTRYCEQELRKITDSHSTKVLNIDMTTYGRMDGEKIVAQLKQKIS